MKRAKSVKFSSRLAIKHEVKAIESSGKDSAVFKQPFWPKSVKYVFGTFCKGVFGPYQHLWSGRWESNPRQKLGKLTI